MADILANRLGNGTDVAYFMNEIVSDGTDLIIRNNQYPNMKSSLPLEELATDLSGFMDIPDSGSDPRSNVYYADNYISAVQADSNCTVPFNNLIEAVYNNGGGIIKLDARIYKVSALYLLSNVFIEGCGQGNTIIQRISETQTGTIRDSDNYGYGFLNIPTYTANCGLKDLTLYGTCIHSFDTTDAFNYVTAGESPVLNGILIEDCANSYSTSGANKVYDNDVLHDRISILMDNESRARKHCLLDNIAIMGFSGNGIFIGANCTEIKLVNSNIINNCAMGVKNYGAGNTITNSLIYGNGSEGLYLGGNNNIINSCRIDYNGFNNFSGAAVTITAPYNQLNAVSCKFNWCNGIVCSSNSNQFINVLLDSNGARSRNMSEGRNLFPNACAQFVLNGGIKNRIQLTLSHSRTGGITPRIGMELLNNARYNMIDVLQDPNSAGVKSAINGSDLNDNIIVDNIIDNIVRYLQS